MNRKNSIAFALAAALGGSACGVSAQESPSSATGIVWGPVTVNPSLDASVRHDDNIFSQQTGEQGSNISVLAPMIRLGTRTGAHEYGLTARIEDGTYHSSEADNYTDYQVAADASLAFSVRTGLRLRAEHNRGHDARGSVVGQAFGSTPNEYTTTGVSGVFGYGAEGAQGRIEINGGRLARRYKNNPALTAVSERDEERVGGTFFWRVMPKTHLLFQVGQTDFDYKLPTSNRDNRERRYLVGITWDATQKTTGTFNIGRVRKDFSSLPDFSGISWEGQIKWSPVTTSTIDVLLSKRPNESDLGSATVDNTTGLAWNHAWNSRLSSALSYTRTRSEYQGSGFNSLIGDRRDTTNAYGVRLSYQAKPWLRVGAGYERFDRTTTAAGESYDRGLVSVFVGAAL